MWNDPETWGYPRPARPGINIPDEESHVIIARNTRVLIDTPHVHIAQLSVHAGGILQAARATDLTLTVTQDVLVDGTLIGPASATLEVESREGAIVNGGLILGGPTSTTSFQGGNIHLRAHRGRVENWGHIQGGTGAPGGWVLLEAQTGLIRNRGEIRGGRDGGPVLLRAPTLDIKGGKILGGAADVTLAASQAILAGDRGTRVAGNAVYALVHSGLLDVPDQETMGWLARERGLWLLGGPGADLNVTGNGARFPPFHALDGGVHVWFDLSHISLDPGTTFADVSTAPLETQNGRDIPLIRLLPHRLSPAHPGADLTWVWDVVNVGYVPARPTLTVTDEAGWGATLTPSELPTLEPGARERITVTFHVPPTASLGGTNRITLRAQAPDMPQAEVVTLNLPLRPLPAYLPWLGHRAPVARGSLSVDMPAAPQVLLTWPGSERNEGLPGRAVLILHTLDHEEVTGGDVAYWDGQRWVPIATTADMENFPEDGVFLLFWDASRIPLTTLYLRGRLWTAEGAIGEVVRSTFLHHAPVAQASATFEEDNTVRLDARESVDLDGDIQTYRWDLGNRETATGPVIRHTFGPGTHVVRLEVTDASGQKDEAVYVLDVSAHRWEEQSACGCASMEVQRSGPSPFALPWEDEEHQALGLDVGSVDGGRIIRYQVGVTAHLQEGSNPRACRVIQEARMSWRSGPAEAPHSASWKWSGQNFPEGANLPFGGVGYTRPNALATWEGRTLRWVFGIGWGSRIIPRGIPDRFLSGEDITLDGTYRARVSGPTGSCTCTWTVHLRVDANGTPTLSVDTQCE